MRYKTLFLLILAAMCSFSASAVDTAEQILQRCADKINKAPSITIKFTLNYGESRSDCQLILSREKYRLSSKDVEVWYDGETQWSYSAADKEVTITDPTPDELLECNPFAIINNYKTAYTFRRLSGEKDEIELTAKSKMSNIRRAVITVNASTGLPSKLIVTMANGRTFTANVSSAVEGKTLPGSTFIYNKVQFPAKTIIDLR